MDTKERDEKNVRQNQWLLKNYERLKTRNHFPEYADSSERISRVNNPGGKKKDLSAIVEKVKALSRCGKSQRQIAELLAISTGSVNKFINI